MNLNYGVNDKGFRKKSYEELLSSINLRAKSLFGEHVNLSSASPLGLIIRLFAFSLSLVWNLAEKVYNSAYIDTASGQSLDYVVKNLNIQRFKAQKAEGYIIIKGKAGTEIKKGWTVTTEFDSAIEYKTLYSVTIDHTGEATAKIIAKKAGSFANVEADTITKIVNPLSGVKEVSNPLRTEFGRDRESDYQLRKRYYNQLGQNSTNIITALTSAILDLGVKQVKVFENNSMVTNELKVPPKSIFVVVLGGDKQKIAKAIFDNKAGGIQAYGKEYIPIEDIGGNIHQIGVTEPEKKEIYLKLDLESNQNYDLDGDQKIKKGILKFFDELMIDEDIIHSKLVNAIYNSINIEGIDDFTLYLGTASDNTAQENINISELEVGRTDLEKIVINHV